MSEDRGLSAAQARRTSRRFAKPRLIAKATEYTIKDGDKVILDRVTMASVKALCPDVKDTTLKRRLESGVRDINDLRASPKLRLVKYKTRAHNPSKK